MEIKTDKGETVVGIIEDYYKVLKKKEQKENPQVVEPVAEKKTAKKTTKKTVKK